MARRKQPVIPDQLLDQLLAGTDAKMAFEKDGLLDELKKKLWGGRRGFCTIVALCRTDEGAP